MDWLKAHQHPDCETEAMNFVTMSHPTADGDGFATRVKRFMQRVLPLIMQGDIVLLEGGFRGYTHHTQGFDSVFMLFGSRPGSSAAASPLSPGSSVPALAPSTALVPSAAPSLSSAWPHLPPAELKDKSKTWWYGVLCAYFLRPNPDMKGRMLDAAPHPLDLFIRSPKSSLCPEFLGVHLRYGDNLTGIQVPISKYIDAARAAYHKHGVRLVYVATDSSVAFRQFVEGVSELNLPMTFLHQRGETGSAITDLLSVDFSRPGTSAAGKLIRSEKDTAIVMRNTSEVLFDMTILSHCRVFVGLAISEVSRVSLAIGIARGNIVEYVLY